MCQVITVIEYVEIISLPDNRVPCLFPEKINGAYWRLDRPYRVVSCFPLFARTVGVLHPQVAVPPTIANRTVGSRDGFVGPCYVVMAAEELCDVQS